MFSLTHPSFSPYVTLPMLPYMSLTFPLEGEGVLVSYIDPMQPTHMRRQSLLRSKRFFCTCERCVDPTDGGRFGGYVRCDTCARGWMQPRCRNLTPYPPPLPLPPITLPHFHPPTPTLPPPTPPPFPPAHTGIVSCPLTRLGTGATVRTQPTLRDSLRSLRRTPLSTAGSVYSVAHP